MPQRVINFFLSICFMVFAALQYNDTDPWLWIPIYLYAAIVCLWCGFKKIHKSWLWAGILFDLGYALVLLLKKDGTLDWVFQYQAESLVQTMKATKPWIENTREFGGLLIITMAFAWNLNASKNLNPPGTSSAA